MTTVVQASVSAMPISGQTVVAGVVGAPVRHSLSPLIHNAWLAKAELDAVYVAFEPKQGTFANFANGLRGGIIRGLNVTAPFKEMALSLADDCSPRAMRAGAANLLVFQSDGSVKADNTDGEGLLHAFRATIEAFEPATGPVLVLGAGGAARGAVAAFLDAGAPQIRILNRTFDRAEQLAGLFGDRAQAFHPRDMDTALAGVRIVINATPLGLGDATLQTLPFERLEAECTVMDMVYRPLHTSFLEQARQRGLRTVDGLWMLIGQAIPSFQALFGRPPPDIDIRALALASLETPH